MDEEVKEEAPPTEDVLVPRALWEAMQRDLKSAKARLREIAKGASMIVQVACDDPE